jgi:hypothetical protein
LEGYTLHAGHEDGQILGNLPASRSQLACVVSGETACRLAPSQTPPACRSDPSALSSDSVADTFRERVALLANLLKMPSPHACLGVLVLPLLKRGTLVPFKERFEPVREASRLNANAVIAMQLFVTGRLQSFSL